MNVSSRHRAVVRSAALTVAVLVSWIALPRAGAVDEPVDLEAVQKIAAEAQANSKVMEFASYLTDVYGPRLTNSPQIRRAAEYVLSQFSSMGLNSPRLERWGPFGRGWTNERLAVHVVAPAPWPVEAFPKAWTPGTEGPARGEAVRVSIDDEKDFASFRGKLRGKFALVSELRELRPSTPPQLRWSDADLEKLTRTQVTRERQSTARATLEARRVFRAKRMAFFRSEGALAVLEMAAGDRGDNGAFRVQGVLSGEGSRDLSEPAPLPQLVVSPEHYGRIVRTLIKQIPVVLEVDVRNTFVETDLDSFNVIADLPGIGKPEEIVMIGAHLDSWHTATGATDDAAGSAVVMEAMRLLKESGLPMLRTVRSVLWTGEEQGLLGSRAFVKEHMGDPATMRLGPDHGKLAAYFNIDNGGGAIRGVYLQGNHLVAPIFRTWMEPFHDYGMSTLTLKPTSGTDHVPFDEVGLPGFQFIQDPLDYYQRSHHTNLDTYERLVPDDMRTNAVILASFAYLTANRPEMLPRKPLPEPRQLRAQPATTKN